MLPLVQVMNIKTIMRYFTLFFILNLHNLVCTLCSKHISVWTSRVTRAQWPHEDIGYHMGHVFK